MSWYNRHRSPTEQGKGGGTTAERREPATPPGRDKGKGDRAQEESQAVGGEPDAAAARPVKKFQRAVRTKVLRILSWYNRHRSSRPKDDEPSAGQPPLAAEEEDGKKPTAAAAEEDGKKDSKTKPGPDTEEGGSDPGKPHRKWKEEEKRLEGILEEAFTRLLAPEYKRQLNATKRKCLLTFSVFELDSKVKKQAMMYWWVAQFHLPYRSDLRAKNEDALDGEGFVAKICSQLRLPYHRRSSDLPNNNTSAPGTSTTTAAPAARNDLPAAPPDQAAAHDDKKPHAEGGDVSKLPGLGSILPHRRSGDHPRNKNSAAPGNAAARDDGDAEKVLIKLSDLGFLEPIKNYCCEVIHGCKVNPLVHWMVKRLARDDAFAELDEDGRPTTTQATSGILCLTAGYRSKLQKRRIAELQAGNVPKSTAQAKNEPSRTPSTKSPKKDAEIMGNNDATSTEKTKSKTMTKTSLPRQKEVEEQAQIIENNDITSVEQTTKSKAEIAPFLPRKTKVEEQTQVTPNTVPKDVQIEEIKGKQVILNVDAHVYPFSKSLFEHLADSLTMLQLGRWCHHDDKTYMEVDGLESLCAINKLRNIRYLSLRGLSRLSKLPCGIDKLKSLEILDMRGCQNLVTIAKNDLPLKSLTHLDLTECYMLEYIGRGITSLTNLQVFKGFVFGSGTQGNTGCRIHDLKKLNALQKLTISITTDANIRKGDLAELKNLTKLRSLTITWSEIPSILLDGEIKIKQKREELLQIWTRFELPQVLEKLDLRCYPTKSLELRKNVSNLKKLYLRGGELENFTIPEQNNIRTLRLRYLKNFNMNWADIIAMLKEIERVEIRVKDEKLLKDMVSKENDKKDFVEDLKKEHEMIEKMMIPRSILDENGIWMKDNKELENQKGIIDQPITSKSNGDDKEKTGAQDAAEMRKGSSLGPSASPNTEDTTTI